MTGMDAQTMLAGGAVLLGALALVAGAALAGWRDWLAVRQLELEGRRPAPAPPPPPPGARIELADLKERVRKLEAIAAGVDL